jgi:hypothetical protein
MAKGNSGNSAGPSKDASPKTAAAAGKGPGGLPSKVLGAKSGGGRTNLPPRR